MFSKKDKTKGTTTPDNQVRILIGLVEGDCNLFQVEVPIENNVLQLKNLVWEQRKNSVFHKIDPAMLTLFKGSIS
jgi:hypothetical protein